MNEKIVVEQITIYGEANFSDFPKINELLKSGWVVKNWHIDTHTNPVSVLLVAVLQEVSNTKANA